MNSFSIRGVKLDYPAVLAPGFHRMCVRDLQRLLDTCQQTKARWLHSAMLDVLIGSLMLARVSCRLFVGGSHLTLDPEPADIDLVLVGDVEQCERATPEQNVVLKKVNEKKFDWLDTFWLCPPGHAHFDPYLHNDLIRRLAYSRVGTPRGVAVVGFGRLARA